MCFENCSKIHDSNSVKYWITACCFIYLSAVLSTSLNSSLCTLTDDTQQICDKLSHFGGKSVDNYLTLFLLNLDMPCLCKLCRSRSVGFRRTFICHANANCIDPDQLALVKLRNPMPLQTMRSRSVGFFRSQLVWICTVCHYVNLYQQPGSSYQIGWK